MQPLAKRHADDGASGMPPRRIKRVLSCALWLTVAVRFTRPDDTRHRDRGARRAA